MTAEVEHKARLSIVPSVKWFEHQATELTLGKVSGVEQRVYQANQLPSRNVCSVKILERQAGESTLRKEPCLERSVRPVNQSTLTNNIGINLRCLVHCLLILVVAAPVCTFNEDIKSTYRPERSKRQRDSGTDSHPSSWPPKYESTMLYREEKLSLTCNKGQFLNAIKGKCFPCPKNTFMPKDNHTDGECIECAVDPYSHQQILEPGNTTHGPIFGCISGYYRGQFREDKHMCDKRECYRCTNCSVFNKYEKRPCGNDSDAECCEEEDMVVVNDSCTREMTTLSPLPANSTSVADLTCPRNYYLDSGNNTCQPCPHKTYLDMDNHTNQSCLNCSEATMEVKPSGCLDSNGQSEKGIWAALVAGVIVAAVIIGVLVFICIRYKKCLPNVTNRFCRKSETPERGAYTQAENGSQVLENNVELETM